MDQTDTDELVRAHVRAFNERDLDGLLRTLTDDAVWTTGRTTVRGRDELAGFFAGAFAGLDATLAVRTLVSDQRVAAVELTETFDGTRAVPVAGFYELAGGRIARARIYREGSADPEAGRSPAANPSTALDDSTATCDCAAADGSTATSSTEATGSTEAGGSAATDDSPDVSDSAARSAGPD